MSEEKANVPHDVDVSPNNTLWQTVMVMPSLADARAAAGLLLTEQVRHGMFFARVRPHVATAFDYSVEIGVKESGVN